MSHYKIAKKNSKALKEETKKMNAKLQQLRTIMDLSSGEQKANFNFKKTDNSNAFPKVSMQEISNNIILTYISSLFLVSLPYKIFIIYVLI